MNYYNEKKSLIVWVLFLSLGSGYINVTTMTRFDHPSSHMTGIVSKIALKIFEGEGLFVMKLLSILFYFLLGAMLSGFIFHERKLETKKRYGILLFIGGLVIFILKDLGMLFYFLVFFMGLQNSMFLVYRGHLVRSTHLTGYISDVGFEIGNFLAKKSKHPWKIGFYFSSIFLFALGGLLSVFLNTHGMQLEFLSVFYILLGIGYSIFVRKRLA